MAKLRIFQEIKNNVWSLRFVNDMPSLSASDKQLIEKYGQPELNLGGTFLGSTENEFVLADRYVHIVDDSPWTVEFDALTVPFNTNTQTKVEGYRDAIKDAFAAALTALRAKGTDTFTAEKVYDNL